MSVQISSLGKFGHLLRGVLSVVLLSVFSQSHAVDIQLSQFVDDPDPATRGGTFTYTLNVENNAGDTANGVVLTLPLPATTQFVSVTSGQGCTHNGATPGTVTCNLGSMLGSLAGGPVKSINVVVRTTASTGDTLNASASVTASNEGANTGNNSLTQNTTIDNGADLVLLKTATPAPPSSVVAGATASFTLAVNNAGPNDSGVVTVTDTLPTNMTYVSASGTGWGCGVAGQVVTCTRVALANGTAAADITVVGRVTGAVTGTLTNTATVASTVNDPEPNNNTRTADISVTQGADLRVNKTVSPSPVISGQAATFTITPVNGGPFTATSVTLADTLPAGFTYVSASGSGWTCNEAAGVVTCTRASFSVGASVPITLTATAPVVATSTAYTNHVEIASAVQADPDPANNQYDLTFNVAPDGVDLSVSKTKTPNPVAEGANMTSTMRVTNNGPSSAGAGTVTVTDTLLSASETYVSHSGSNWSCLVAGAPQIVTCTYSAALAMGAVTTDLIITTTAGASGSLSNTACAVYAGGPPFDAVPGNNCQTRSVTSTPSAQVVDLRISKTADAGGDTVLTNNESSITYTLVVTNDGPGGADGVVVSDPIPGYVAGTGVSASMTASNNAGAQPTFSCTTGSTVTCTQTGGVIENGKSATFTIMVTRPLTEGTLNNTATVTSTTLGDPDPSNNSASATVTSQAIADVELQSKLVIPDTVKAGVNATYVLTFRNNGPATAAAVTVDDVFTVPGGDAGFTLISYSASHGSCSGLTAGNSYGPGSPTLNCVIGSMASGASHTVTVVIRPNWQAGQGGNRTLSNTATIDTTTFESVSDITDNGNNSKTATLTIQPAEVDVLVNKNDLPPSGPDPMGYDPLTPANNVITYKLRITNRGPSLATGVAFTDSITPPAGKTITFLGDDASIGAVDGDICNNVGTTSGAGVALNLTCTLPASVEANASVDRYLRFRVNEAPATGGSIFSNSATVSSNETDTALPNNVAVETTTVRALVDLRLVKSASVNPVQLRQPFNWLLTVTNLGPGDSNQTTVTDTLPAGVDFFGAAPSWSNSGGGSGTCATSGQVLSCNFGQVTNGQVVTVTIPSRVTAYTATKQNCATASTSEVDNVSGNSTNQCLDLPVQRSSLTGFVYDDADDDGSMAGVAETGIDGVNVRLTGTDAYDNTVDTTVATAGGGIFTFSDLSPSGAGGYTLTETQPTGYVDGLDNKAGTVVVGSKLTDTITSITLPGNTAASGYLFGERVEAGISGFVWFDANNNGDKESGETLGIRGVSIHLTGTDDLGQLVDRTTTTSTSNDSGAYSFAGVRPGTYTLTETHPTAWVDGIDKAGTGATTAGVAGNDTITGIVLSSYGQAAVNYNFGELGGSLAGRVYHDGNTDGIRQPDEPGIAGVTLTLAGTDANDQPVSRTATTGVDGTYSFPGLPVPNGTGYTLTEYNPPSAPTGFTDGQDKVGSLGGTLGNDVISAIPFPAAGANGTGYDFGERMAAPAQLSGTVWLDSNHDRANNDASCGARCASWTVELIQRDLPTDTRYTLLASTTTDASGNYRFTQLIPGTYEVRFLHPETSSVYGKPVSAQPGVDLTYGTIRNLTLASGDNVVNQNLPLDPSGVVYDSVTGKPLQGAVVELRYPGGTVPASCLLGGNPVTTGSDGYYEFWLLPGPPPGCPGSTTYTLKVTVVPGGYLPAPSALVPACGGVLGVLGVPSPAKVRSLDTGPAVTDYRAVTSHVGLAGACPVDTGLLAAGNQASSQYFYDFSITLGTSANVVNNHIPLDPVLSGAIRMTKTTPLINVSKGDLVPYTITATNTLNGTLSNVDLPDLLPPGFKYKTGSATWDDDCNGPIAPVHLEPTVNGRTLTWTNRTFTASGTAQSCKRIKLLLVVGAGVGEGEYTNQIWAVNTVVNTQISNTAAATVRVVPDPTFDCSDLIGKVFDDKNANGYQDEGEPGIPNVRVATARGLLVTTDKDGRFHVACADIPQAQRGSNFIMKLDERSLPSGYRLTTENPREVRTTRGKMVKLNFGAAIHRVVRLELSDAAFQAGKADPAAALAGALDKLPETLRAKPSVVRLAYQSGKEGGDLAKARLRAVRERLEELWKAQGCCYTLVFEEEIFERAVRGSAK